MLPISIIHRYILCGYAIGLCVSSSDKFLQRSPVHHPKPNGVINYTGMVNATLSKAENVTAETFEARPSDFSWLAMSALVMYIVAFSPCMGPVPHAPMFGAPSASSTSHTT